MAKKHKPKFDLNELEKEYRTALQDDPERAKELKKKIDYFNWGIE